MRYFEARQEIDKFTDVNFIDPDRHQVRGQSLVVQLIMLLLTCVVLKVPDNTKVLSLLNTKVLVTSTHFQLKSFHQY